MKKFFFNKIEKNKTTSFFDLIISLLYGALKIYLFMIIPSAIMLLNSLYGLDNMMVESLISILLGLVMLAYVFGNRIPNQIKVFSNFFHTLKLETANRNLHNRRNSSNQNVSIGQLKVSRKEIRVMIVLMLINTFALFVNYFALSPRLSNESGYKAIRLFTNSTQNGMYPFTSNYDYNHFDNFYPFVKFYYNDQNYGLIFNGIFPYYDTSEFFVYTILIVGVMVIKKIW
jgi:hypothetical protein